MDNTKTSQECKRTDRNLLTATYGKSGRPELPAVGGGYPLAGCQEFRHGQIKSNPLAWKVFTTPVGMQDAGGGAVLVLGLCMYCQSTLARPATEAEASLYHLAGRAS